MPRSSESYEPPTIGRVGERSLINQALGISYAQTSFLTYILYFDFVEGSLPVIPALTHCDYERLPE